MVDYQCHLVVLMSDANAKKMELHELPEFDNCSYEMAVSFYINNLRMAHVICIFLLA